MPQLSPVQSYFAPNNLQACLEIVAREGDKAVILAGGQSVMPILKTRGLRPQVLLDLGLVEELRANNIVNGSLVLGAMSRHRDIWTDRAIQTGWSALADAAAGVGDRQIQNRGTLGGNLAFGTVVTDMKQVVMCLGAKLHIIAMSGERHVDALELFADPEKKLLGPGELLKAVQFPGLGAGAGSAYRKYGITANGRPVVGIAGLVRLDDAGVCLEARIVVGGLVPAPRVAKYAAQMLEGKPVDAKSIGAAADAAAEEVKPQTDTRATSAYRRQLIRSYGRTVLEQAYDRARGGNA